MGMGYFPPMKQKGAILLLVFLFGAPALAQRKVKLPKTQSYASAWKALEEAKENQLPKDAHAIADSIYQLAARNDDAPNHIQALVQKLTLRTVYTEEQEPDVLAGMEQSLEADYFPFNPIMHALIGTTYYDYMPWQTRNRTIVDGPPGEDLSLWDSQDYYDTICFHLETSLRQADRLFKVPVEYVELICTTSEDHQKQRIYKPTLYDLLVENAINFYRNNSNKVPARESGEAMDDAWLFDNSDAFLQRDIPAGREGDHWASIRLMQDIMRRHMEAGNDQALAYWDRQRYEFLARISSIADSDVRYMKALEELFEKHHGSALGADIGIELGRRYMGLGESYDANTRPEHRWKLKEAERVFDRVIRSHPNAAAAKQSKQYKESMRIPELQLRFLEHMVAYRKTPVGVRYKNVDKLFVKLYRAEFEAFPMGMDEGVFEALIASGPIHDTTCLLDDEGDRQQHTIEIELPAMERGFYFLSVGTAQQLKYEKGTYALSGFWVSDLHAVSLAKEGKAEVRVMDAEHGRPIEGVNVSVMESTRNDASMVKTWEVKETQTTGADGIVEFNIGRWGARVRCKTQDDETWVSVNNHQQVRKEDQEPRIWFYTDRAIYRPGQQVQYKGYAIRHENVLPFIVPDLMTVIELKDANREVVKKDRVKTNAFGTFSGTFNLPRGRLSGSWMLDPADVNGSTYFKVEEYKRPQFEVQLEQPTAVFQLNDSVHLVGKAKAYSGASISNAHVRYTVSRSVIIPWMWRWTHPYMGYPGGVEVAQGTGTTDENGAFHVSFMAAADASVPKETNATFRYNIKATVVDQNGETHEAKTSIYVSYVPIAIKLNVAEQLMAQRDTAIELQLVNTAGNPVKGQVSYSLTPLQWPDHPYLLKERYKQADQQLIDQRHYAEVFPLYAYAGEDEVRSWAEGEEAAQGSIALDGKARLRLPLDQLPQGKYKLRFIATDEQGNEVSEERVVDLVNSAASEIPPYEAFRVIPNFEGNSANVGDTLRFVVGTAFTDSRIRFDVEPYYGEEEYRWLSSSASQSVVEVPVIADYQGKLSVRFTMVREGQFFEYQKHLQIPFSQKELDLQLISKRQPLVPGSEETWTVTVKGIDQKPRDAELLLCMYDASLDALDENDYRFMPYHYVRYKEHSWRPCPPHVGYGHTFLDYPQFKNVERSMPYETLKPVDLRYYVWAQPSLMGNVSEVQLMSLSASETATHYVTVEGLTDDLTMAKDDGGQTLYDLLTVKKQTEEQAPPPPRSNFNETAFFIPHAKTDATDRMSFSFTLPESLTRWKFQAIAHTRTLEFAVISETFEARKQVMIVPNVPRFLRVGDTVLLSAKVINMSEELLDARAWLEIPGEFIAQPTEEELRLKPGESKALSWEVVVPGGWKSVSMTYYTQAGKHTDGELHTLPILPREVRVFESMALYHNGNGTRSWSLKDLASGQPLKKLDEALFTLDYTANPAWYVVMALPYLMEFPHECAEQTFNRYYANSLAKFIVQKNPKIKDEFAKWLTEQPELLKSMLERNPELKQIQLVETPWMQAAQNEAAQRARIAQLFDLDHLNAMQSQSLARLQQLQFPSGGWPWFAGMKESRFVTGYILSGIARMKMLGLPEAQNGTLTGLAFKALQYAEQAALKDWEFWKESDEKADKQHVDAFHVQYVFAQALLQGGNMMIGRELKAYKHYRELSQNDWQPLSPYLQGMIALTCHLDVQPNDGTARSILQSLKQRSVLSEEMGRYWKTGGRFSWFESAVEQQSMMIWAFNQFPEYKNDVRDMQRWLLQQKRTQSWESTTATADACHALLVSGGTDLLEDNTVQILLDKEPLASKNRKGVGYERWSWDPDTVTDRSFETLSITGNSGRLSWGGAYLSYMAKPEQVNAHSSGGLVLEKFLYKEVITDEGRAIKPIEEADIAVGDRLIVRLAFKADRAFEYVHLKDQRAVGFEPAEQLSSYTYQNGLRFYRSAKDASMNFFFEYLPKGEHLVEYEVFATMGGRLSNGLGSIQCMYAPEFTAHTAGQVVQVK